MLTINEVRRERNLSDVPWGDTPLVKPMGQNGRGAESLAWSVNHKGH